MQALGNSEDWRSYISSFSDWFVAEKFRSSLSKSLPLLLQYSLGSSQHGTLLERSPQ